MPMPIRKTGALSRPVLTHTSVLVLRERSSQPPNNAADLYHYQMDIVMPRFAYPLLAALLMSCFPLTVFADSPSLQLGPVLEAVDSANLEKGSLAVATLPLDGPGQARFMNADKPLNPGSIMKVVTSYAALELLGPTYQWHTRLYYTGTLAGNTLKGDLYLVGSGDPKLTEERLWRLLREVRSMGIQHIQGDLVLDDSRFQLPNGLPPFHDDGNNPNAPFLVEPDALLTNLNVLRLRARADNRGLHVWSEPQLDGVTLDNQLVYKKYGHCPRRYQFDYQPRRRDDGQVVVTLTGILPKGCSTSGYLSVMPQRDYTATLIQSLWRDQGGTLAGGHRSGTLPSGATLLATTSSRDLVTMVRDINKWSNNVMARQVFLTLGAENRQPDDPDDLAAAEREIREWLERKGIKSRGMVFENGAGLSRIERISARQMASLLKQAWNSRFAAELIASLPLVAMDGTMRRRLGSADMAGQGHIKTGSLRNVRSVAGFTRDKNLTTWAVVAMVNDDEAWQSEIVLDKVIEQVHRATRPRSFSTAGP